MKNYKKNIILLLVSMFIVLAILISVSYAYFALKFSGIDNAINVEATLANSLFNLTSSNDANIAFSVTYENMKYTNSSDNSFVGDQTNYSLELETFNSNSDVVCTYDLVWVWDGESQYLDSTTSLPFTIDDVTYNKEFTIQATSITSGDTTRNYNSNVIPEVNLSNLSWESNTSVENNKAVLLENAIIGHNGIGKTTTSWNFTVKVYNIFSNQNELMNKNYLAHIEIEDAKCGEV